MQQTTFIIVDIVLLKTCRGHSFIVDYVVYLLDFNKKKKVCKVGTAN